jgi:hypothetical protein
MNTVQLPSKFETEILESDALYRRGFRFLSLLRADPAKLERACNALSHIAQGGLVEEGEEDDDE